jgi:hypothetical protein
MKEIDMERYSGDPRMKSTVTVSIVRFTYLRGKEQREVHQFIFVTI